MVDVREGGREELALFLSLSLAPSLPPTLEGGRDGEGGREGAKEQEWERQRGTQKERRPDIETQRKKKTGANKGNLRIEKRNDSWREGLAERPEAGILEAEWYAIGGIRADGCTIRIICMFICLSVYLFVCMFACLHVCLHCLLHVYNACMFVGV